MNILICGSSGFIGTHLTRYLNRVGHQVTGFDLVRPINPDDLVRFVQGDIRVKEQVWPVIADADCVINLAAKHHDFGIEEHEYFDTNQNGTQCLLDGMAQFKVDFFIFYSSVAVYGDATQVRNEQTSPRPISPYGQSKLAAEQAIAQWTEDSFMRSALVIRPALVFGPGNQANMYSLIRQIDRRLFAYFGSRHTIKGTCYVYNLIAATHFLLELMAPGLQTCNYVDSPDLTVEEMAIIIAESLGRRTPLPDLPQWLGLAVGRLFDFVSLITGKPLRVSTQRVRKLAIPTRYQADYIRDLGFTPPFSLETGLRTMVQWYRNPDIYPMPGLHDLLPQSYPFNQPTHAGIKYPAPI